MSTPSTEELLALNDEELIQHAQLTDSEFDQLESDLVLRAGALGWTGDPLRQPLPVVASITRRILKQRPTLNPCS